MSSRCVNAGTYNAYFYLRRVRRGEVHASGLFTSDNTSDGNSFAFRPIITLKSNVQIDTTDETKDSTTAINAYVLK